MAFSDVVSVSKAKMSEVARLAIISSSAASVSTSVYSVGTRSSSAMAISSSCSPSPPSPLAPPLAGMRLTMLKNSSSRMRSMTSALSYCPNLDASRSSVTGTSRRMVVSILHWYARSLFSRRDFCTLGGVTSSMCS